MRALVDAQVHTMETPESRSDAIAWDGDTITAVGDAAVRDWAAKHGVEVEPLGGRIVLPGFVDAHMHFLHVGIKRTRPDLRGAQSKQEALERVSAWLELNPGDSAVTAEGWDEAEWHGDPPPTRRELDALTDRPLVLRRICGHVAVANGGALPAIRKRWDDARVDVDTGTLLEEPSLYLNEVLPADDATLDAAVEMACRVAHHVGVTTVGDYEQLPFRAALLRAARDDRLSVRVQCSIYVQALEEAIAAGFCTGRPVRAPMPGEAGRPAASMEAGPPTASGEAGPLGASGKAGPPGATGGARHAGQDSQAAKMGYQANATAEAPGTTPEAAGARTAGTKAEAAGPRAEAVEQVDAVEDPRSLLTDGGLKVFLDGSLGGHTALMLEPYDDRPETRGRAIWRDEELDHLFRRAAEAGIQIHAHAIGDGAVEQGLQAYERLVTAEPAFGTIPCRDPPTPAAPTRSGHALTGSGHALTGSRHAPTQDQDAMGRPSRLHHRFEHYEIVHDDQVERTVRLGIWASSQPNFVGAWSAKGGMYEERIGERFHRNNRFQSFQRAGLRVAFGSDGMPFGPLYGIQSAIQHPAKRERMDVAEAVWHYTHEAADSLGRPDLGRLVPGAKADLLLLDQTDLAEPEAWTWETVVAGQSAHRGTQPYLSDDDVKL